MTSHTAKIAIIFTGDQLRKAYQALSNVPTECRREGLELYAEHHAEWDYQLPDDARFRMQQLKDRETWAIETMGILSCHCAILGVPAMP